MLQDFPSVQRGTKMEKKMHQGGRDQFSQHLPCRSAKKAPVPPTTKWQSQRVLGTQPFPESSWAAPGGAGPDRQVKPAKNRGWRQEAGTPQFKNRDGKLPSGAGSRNHVLGGRKARSGEQHAGLWWQLSSENTEIGCPENQWSLPYWK